MTIRKTSLAAALVLAGCSSHRHQVTSDPSTGTLLSVEPARTPTPVPALPSNATEWDAAVHALESCGLHPAPLTRPGLELTTDWHLAGEKSTLNLLGGPTYTI